MTNPEILAYINPKATEYPTRVIEKPQVVPPIRKPEAEKKHDRKDGKK